MADFMRAVVFKVENQLFGVDIEKVQSIEKQIDVVSVPNSMPFISGIVNLRGDVIPVFSLKKKFSMLDAQNECENTIIIALPDVSIALEVDEVMEITDFGADKLADVPGIVMNESTQYLDKVASNNGSLILLLDVDKLVSADEAADIRRFAEDMKNE
ncbi:MAG: chemotaxis protein CheW [Eubacteriales bacterium]|nr:chemotaxis protein CheW [Eubacteriales bacterium]